MRILASLFLLLAVTASAAAADAPAGIATTYAIVRARFVPKEPLVNPEGPDVYIGVKVKGEVQVTQILSGKPDTGRFSAELWLPKKSAALDVFLLVEKQPEGAPQIAAWSMARAGFCILPEQALDGPTADIARLRKEYPCKRR